MDKNKFLSTGLLEQYVLGLTSPEESELVEKFAEEFPEIQKEINAMRRALEDYARSNAIPPPKGMKDQILSEIETMENGAAASQFNSIDNRPRGTILRYASLLLVLFAAALAFFYYNKSINSEQNYAQLAMEYDELQQDCSRRQAQYDRVYQQYAVINDHQTKHVHIRGTGKFTDDALAVVYYNSNNEEAILQLVNFPSPPEDKQYQIWADVEGEMINMGVFDCKMNTLQAVKFIDEAESLNITLEPKGGSDHPTVENLYANGLVSS